MTLTENYQNENLNEDRITEKQASGKQLIQVKKVIVVEWFLYIRIFVRAHHLEWKHLAETTTRNCKEMSPNLKLIFHKQRPIPKV